MTNDAPKKMTIIAWSGDLDKAYPTMILATTAAASGMEVTIFFTFWGLFILKKNDAPRSGNDAMTKMLGMMNKGGSDNLGLSKLNMGGMGSWMMRQIFKKNQVADLGELIEMGKEMGIKYLPCQMTMDALGLTREMMIDGLGEPAGAATALAEMAESQINLFI